MRSEKSPNDTWVALLRGINVGGNNKLPMRDLAAMLTEAGATDVQTYIQSGNAVFKAPATLAAKIPDALAKLIQQRLAITIPVVLFSAQELEAATQNNPYLTEGADTDALHVMFLAQAPSAAAVASLDPDRSPPDAFTVVDRCVYLRCPNGLARTKLSNAWMDSKLATTSTCRNWRTVLKLLELSRPTA